MAKKIYEEKLTTADGTVLLDLYMIVKKQKENVKLLPDITWVDIYYYLINTPSSYMNENLKAYKFSIYNYLIYTPSSYMNRNLKACLYYYFISDHVSNPMLNLLQLTICQNSALFKLRSFFTIKGLSLQRNMQIFRLPEMFCFNAFKLYYNLVVIYFVFTLTLTQYQTNLVG